MIPASGQYNNYRMATWPHPQSTTEAVRQISEVFPHHVRLSRRIDFTGADRAQGARSKKILMRARNVREPKYFYVDIREWLHEEIGPCVMYMPDPGEPVDKVYWTDGRWGYVGYENFPAAFCFADADEAFAFKMRWG